MTLAQKFFKKEINQRRWRQFARQKRSVWGLWIFVVAVFFSFTAEFWSNSKPLMMKYHGRVYAPVLWNYQPADVGVTDRMNIDYKALVFENGDWAVWPLNRWDPFESNKNVERYPSKPSRENLFGTDDRGRDILSRLLYGFRYSIAYAVLVWVLTVIVAVAAGGVMGYAGGTVDIIGQRLVEILNTVPLFFLLIILVSVFEPSLWMLIVLTSLFSWIGLSYYVRGEFLKQRKREYVEAARGVGATHARIIFRHILPNSMVPVITFSPFIIASHILGLASLDFLGFGLREPTPSWGELLNEAQKNFTIAWWLAVFPGVALILTLVVLSLVGDGVRNAYDPKR